MAGGFGSWVAVAALLSMGVRAGAQATTAVSQLDLKQFVGKWYEVDRLPNKQERMCVADAVTLYTLRVRAGQFDAVQSCRLQDGTPHTRNFRGKVADKSGNGQLKAIYTWPFSHKYWVLGLGESYAWALVGTPDHKQLWLLSRTPALTPEMLAAARAQAASEGFDVTKLKGSNEVGQRQ